jgi:hypothetical protein
LAGESSDEAVGVAGVVGAVADEGLSIGRALRVVVYGRFGARLAEQSDVGAARHVWPVLREQPAAPRVKLALHDDAHPGAL